jgi:hypothetical protein
MLDCYQFKDMNMLEHGQMVHEYFIDLHGLLANRPTKFQWDIPEETQNQLASMFKDVLLIPQVKDYHLFHDNAKFESKYIDEDGKQHFPDHALNSYNRWLSCGGDGITAYLILNDMYYHITKPNCVTLITYGATLLWTAWAEVHANAEMFGGVESTSFKIKKKHLIKVTKKVKYD